MKPSGKMEAAANGATIVVAVLLSVVLIKVYLLPKRAAPRTVPGPTVGTNLKTALPGVNWHKNGRTLLLAISTQCHFCRASTPFFRTLVAKAGNKIKIVAVLPQPVDVAQKYLNGEGVRVDQVEQADLNRIGVRGTPTMLLVNSAGVVTNVWVGELQPTQQSHVLSVLAKAPAAGALIPPVRPFVARP